MEDGGLEAGHQSGGTERRDRAEESVREDWGRYSWMVVEVDSVGRRRMGRRVGW